MSEPATPPPRRQPVIACQGVTKVFKDFWMRDRARAVDSLTFEVYPREVFGLLGPNGSGKSTTIKMILGLLRPTSGRIAVFARPPSDVVIKRRIGYLPEESYLYPFLNARETLEYYGKLFEIDHAVRRRRIDELLDMVGLTHAQYRPVRDYSKGMQRRIGIAQALINDPDLLILDEPTTGLDPIGTRQVKDLIVELGRRGKTVLLSSHLLADVEDCVDRLVILYGGRKRDEGTCDSMLERRSRTTIETDALDDATIAEIDALLRRRSGGERAILRVGHPRQTLEEKFLDIVEQAQRERAATSGVVHGGATAAFLRGPGTTEGDALISDLMAQEPPPPPAQPAPPAEPAPMSVLESLVDQGGGKPDAGAAPTRSAEPATPDESVDESVISSLLDRPREDEQPGRTP
ncbi:MAG: ABC transporter ATP-binding protein [Leptolyngbya sp. PLA2]|nr:ABC transporter ATP-binding protein [Leptolyngbya sp.]MCE7971172.1 ABC transporter ATP-binding protein [Leptolyngbya sp. PL-A2]MCQ3940851.1 ABC transporter ATP-binding protein [cyanobacterium CYA1]MCZ7634127.1 ABC transporter ATP-binding protein [Phycisphaerales bacterium]MDL1905165.1 ABC transporter ATP-binding protein [Synechococcales cyanobacterium CNB]GIK19285.1 MAG: ABC transporter ATP-binding protein [Planctomycetota bacterium]